MMRQAFPLVALAALAGKNWPKQGEVSGIDDDAGDGDGGGEG